jgi:hypothetical protein
MVKREVLGSNVVGGRGDVNLNQEVMVDVLKRLSH